MCELKKLADEAETRDADAQRIRNEGTLQLQAAQQQLQRLQMR